MTRYEVNYVGGHELQLFVLSDYELGDAIHNTEADKWKVTIRTSGAMRIPLIVPGMGKQIRIECIWLALYMAARAYALLSRYPCAQQIGHIRSALSFIENALKENPDCRLRKLYGDFLKMLTIDETTYSVPCNAQQISYSIPSVFGVPNLNDLPAFIDFILTMPKQVGCCSGAYVPKLVLEHRVVSSYEYASFSSIIFQQEADAVLCTLAE